MSILTDTLPDSVEINGKRCQIRSDFKTWIRVSSVMFGREDSVKKTAKILSLVFPKLPERLDSAINAVVEFYQPFRQGSAEDKPARRIYDYEYDSEMIYAAFLQQYGVDLNIAELHWWQFRAMFDSLSDDTQFVKAMQFRGMDISQIKDKQQRKCYSKMKSIYALPDNRTDAQKESDMNAVFAEAFL